MDDDGQAFVYVVTAAQLEKKPIEIIYQTDDYCLVAQSAESNALRAGNEDRRHPARACPTGRS